jgi:hypothetical protein
MWSRNRSLFSFSYKGDFLLFFFIILKE